MIHFGTVSQTIRVPIDDSPTQVKERREGKLLSLSLSLSVSSPAQVLASFFAKMSNKRVLLGIPEDLCEADFVLRVCGRYLLFKCFLI